MNILQKTKQYIIDFKNEAPWYFWAYILLVYLKCLIFGKNDFYWYSIPVLFLYSFLLKKVKYLRCKCVYITIIISSVFTFYFHDFLFNTYIIELDYFLMHIFISFFVSCLIIFIIKKNITILQSITVFLMSFSIKDSSTVLYLIVYAFLYSS